MRTFFCCQSQDKCDKSCIILNLVLKCEMCIFASLLSELMKPSGVGETFFRKINRLHKEIDTWTSLL